MAKELAKRSTCLKAHVGCIITDDKGLIVSAGFNGSVPGADHCNDVGCLIFEDHCIRTLHAEANALARIYHKPTSELFGYCTHKPCLNCLKVGLTHGISSWWYLKEYEDRSRDEFLRHHLGINLYVFVDPFGDNSSLTH